MTDSNQTPTRRLAESQTDFHALRQADAVFVDKTAQLAKLCARTRKFTLMRPEGFGKTLLLSMMETLFSEGTQAFKGLAIEKVWTDKTYKVIRLDFQEFAVFSDYDDLQKRLLTRLARVLGFEPSGNVELSIDLWQWLGSQAVLSYVLLIDNYDAPIVFNVNDDHLRRVAISVIASFFTLIKTCDGAFRFVFVTGLSYDWSSEIRTRFNHAQDLTDDDDVAALLGFTEAEIRSYFGEHLSRAAKTLCLTEDELFGRLRENYGGYCFDGDSAQTRVFSPKGVIGFLACPKRGFGNLCHVNDALWCLVSKSDCFERLADGKDIRVSLGYPDKEFDKTQSDIAKILLRTGILTIRAITSSEIVELAYPNTEIANRIKSKPSTQSH
ncbi:MAG: AAA family ATPase [Sutterellaceae bacterium]|nr:AAA family ATPase [Sutterellaceae bacterium]